MEREPRKSALELLTFVRQVSQRVPEAKIERSTFEGVDVLSRRMSHFPVLPVKNMET